MSLSDRQRAEGFRENASPTALSAQCPNRSEMKLLAVCERQKAPSPGLEPGTTTLTAWRSTN